MERWYFSKPFLRQCESANFDWVTKAKRNTKLFRRLNESGIGRERFVPIQPRTGIRGSIERGSFAENGAGERAHNGQSEKRRTIESKALQTGYNLGSERSRGSRDISSSARDKSLDAFQAMNHLVHEENRKRS